MVDIYAYPVRILYRFEFTILLPFQERVAVFLISQDHEVIVEYIL